jgi:uncharacterized protein (TIGR00730 family)
MSNINDITDDSLDFVKSSEGRIARILIEFLDTKTRLEKEQIQNTIVMFGSARILPPNIAKQNLDIAINSNASNEEILLLKNKLDISKYYDIATNLSYRFAKHFKNSPANEKFYICSGGGPGIMEAVNKGANLAGEKTLGFNIILPFEQSANPYLTKDLTFNFKYFFLRKFWFSYLAKAFIVFPGGFGTMDELFEILTLIQTHKMQKKIPIVMLDKEFFTKVLNIKMLEEYGLISSEDKNLFLLTDSIDEAFDYIVNDLQPYKPIKN